MVRKADLRMKFDGNTHHTLLYLSQTTYLIVNILPKIKMYLQSLHTLCISLSNTLRINEMKFRFYLNKCVALIVCFESMQNPFAKYQLKHFPNEKTTTFRKNETYTFCLGSINSNCRWHCLRYFGVFVIIWWVFLLLLLLYNSDYPTIIAPKQAHC